MPGIYPCTPQGASRRRYQADDGRQTEILTDLVGHAVTRYKMRYFSAPSGCKLLSKFIGSI